MVPSLGGGGGGGCRAQHFLERPGAGWWRRGGRSRGGTSGLRDAFRPGASSEGRSRTSWQEAFLATPKGVASAHNYLYNLEPPVAAETLARCWAEGMRETWSLIWESVGDGMGEPRQWA